MASPNTSYTDIITMTIESRTREIADGVTESNALLERLSKKENGHRTISGGTSILQELSYAENTNYIRYSGMETLPIAEQEEFTAASFAWKQAACAIPMSGLDRLKNSGKEAFINLAAARMTNAERTMRNNITGDLYSNGTATSSKQIGGLQLLVSDTPTTGTVGGISRDSYTFWRNVMNSAANQSATTIQANMYTTWLSLVRGSEGPDLIVTDNLYWQAYNLSLTANQRFTDPDMAELGFRNLMFQNAPVILDGGYGGSCPASHMYFLNTDYIHFCTHADRNFVPLGGKRFSTNQDADVTLLAWAGNATLSNAFMQGVNKG